MAEEFKILRRNVMNQEEFDNKYGYHTEDAGLLVQGKKVFRKCTQPCASVNKLFATLLAFIPIVKWLPKYNLKAYLLRDIIGGFTTGVMHVPQGIAYSVLSGVAPVYGLYSSFFPALFYMIFGTSRHTSIGSFAVVALMSGIANDQIMSTYSTPSTNSTVSSTQTVELTPIIVAQALTFTLGIIQFATGLLRLEFVTTYFSDQLVAGFTTGSACHVFAAQIDDVLGVNVPKVSGPGYLFRRFYDILLQIPHANVCTVITSAIGILFLYVGKDFISPFVNKRLKMKIPIPYELILVIVSTAISYLFSLHERYGMNIVGNIPAGMPIPRFPDIQILPECLPHAIGIAAVTIAVHISMAKMLAKKMDYEIDPGQEFYALGLSAMLGGLFPIYPVSTALGRTMVNVESGSKTQLSALFSCLLLLIIILWLGPLLQTLPMCILAVIIIMALRAMFRKLADLKRLWGASKIDCLIWLVAFVSTVAIDVMLGLAISIVFALLTIVFRSQWPRSETLAPTGGGEDFENLQKYKALSQYPDIHIFRFDSPLFFTNVENFKAKILKQMKSWSDSDSDTNDSVTDRCDTKEVSSMRFLIIDCSCMSFIDCMGVNALKEAVHDTKSRRVTLLFAAATVNMREMLQSNDFFSTLSKEYFFPTIQDAFCYAIMTSEKSSNDSNGSVAKSNQSGDSSDPLSIDYPPSTAVLPTTNPVRSVDNIDV